MKEQRQNKFKSILLDEKKKIQIIINFSFDFMVDKRTCYCYVNEREIDYHTKFMTTDVKCKRSDFKVHCEVDDDQSCN